MPWSLAEQGQYIFETYETTSINQKDTKSFQTLNVRVLWQSDTKHVGLTPKLQYRLISTLLNHTTTPPLYSRRVDGGSTNRKRSITKQ